MTKTVKQDIAKRKRFVVFITFLLVTFCLYAYVHRSVFINKETPIILYILLIMLSFISLFIGYFFAVHSGVIMTTISILLLLSPFKGTLQRCGIWFDIFYFYNLALLIISFISILLLKEKVAEDSFCSHLSKILKEFAEFFGEGKFLYFSLLILAMLFYTINQSKYFVILFLYSALILIIEPKNLYGSLQDKYIRKKNIRNGLRARPNGVPKLRKRG